MVDFSVPPSWVLGTLIALLYAALFKLVLPEQTRNVFVLSALALFGFFLGNYVAGVYGLTILRLGELNLLGSSFGCVLVLAIANLWRP
jgi:hypothetical protein